MIKDKEIFKKHKSGYLVSNYGKIKGKLVEFLKPTSSNGYLMCNFGLIHRIVVETFISDIPKGMQVNHIDGIKSNNRLDNLEIVTPSENQLHAYRIGLTPKLKGELNGCSELTEKEVLEMYKLFKIGIPNKEIGDKYKIHDRYVSLIRHGKRWKYLFDEHFKPNEANISLGRFTLTKKSLLLLIQDIVDNKLSNVEIGDKYNLDKTSISKIRNKRTYKEIWRLYDRRND